MLFPAPICTSFVPQKQILNTQILLFVPPSFRGTNTTILRNQSLIPLFHHNPFPLFPYSLIP